MPSERKRLTIKDVAKEIGVSMFTVSNVLNKSEYARQEGGEVNLKITVKFFAYLRELFQGKERQIELKNEATVGELLNFLCNSAECRNEIFIGGMIKPALLVMKNGTHICDLNGLETELEDGDVIAIFPFLGGG